MSERIKLSLQELRRDLVLGPSLFAELRKLILDVESEISSMSSRPNQILRRDETYQPDKEINSLIDFFLALNEGAPYTNPVKVKAWQEGNSELRIAEAGEFSVNFIRQAGKWVFAGAYRKAAN